MIRASRFHNQSYVNDANKVHYSHFLANFKLMQNDLLNGINKLVEENERCTLEEMKEFGALKEFILRLHSPESPKLEHEESFI